MEINNGKKDTNLLNDNSENICLQVAVNITVLHSLYMQIQERLCPQYEKLKEKNGCRFCNKCFKTIVNPLGRLTELLRFLKKRKKKIYMFNNFINKMLISW